MNFLNQIQSHLELILLDAVIVALSPVLGLFIRFEGKLPSQYLDVLLQWDIWMTLIALCIFGLYGLYQRMWHYARIQDLLAIVGAVSVASALNFIAFLALDISFPKSIFLISWMLEIGGIGLSRMMYKISFGGRSGETIKRVLILGAGDGGALLVRELESHPSKVKTKIVGFLDDDTKKIGSKLAGIPVLGAIDELDAWVERKPVDEIIIAIPSADGDTIRRMTAACRKSGCKVRIMPGLYDMISDQVSAKALRDVNLEDLLRRAPIHLDFERITGYIAGKTVLITGAGGSIGSELARQISQVGSRRILLLGRGENSIYLIHQELTARYPNQEYYPIIANITDRNRMEEVFREYQPEVVFHAAAHKHVPLMEMQPAEAVHNNVLGTKNVAELADSYKSEIFVLISTDKAVNPTSVMGATKRTAELVLQDINAESQTKYVTVRFGNVLGSRGSVVPLFEKQIAEGGPVTITHPEITRYFMTIPEAVQLVLQAGSQAEGGEVFLFDMGKPIKIKDMACDLIELHGLVPNQDIKITYTGLRPGEKLYEELLTAEEGTTSTKHKKIFKAQIHPLESDKLEQQLQLLLKERSTPEIIRILKELIPTYHNNQVM